MNDIRNIVDKYDFKVKKYRDQGTTKVIDTDKGKFVLKKKKSDNKKELYNYLSAKRFDNYVKLYNDHDDEYEIYPYVDDLITDSDDKALDIIFLTTMLHNKTTFYKNFSTEEKKKNFEDHNNRLDYLMSYYDNIRWIIEEDPYPSPSNYMLLRNLSLIYIAIDSSRFFMKKWYDIVEKKKNKRVARIHGNLSLDHLIESDNIYLISWDNSRIDSPALDFYYFYQNNYLDLDFTNLFNVYLSKYPLLEEEKYLLFSLLLCPVKLELVDKEIINTRKVYNLIEYLARTNEFVSKHYPKESHHETGNQKQQN